MIISAISFLFRFKLERIKIKSYFTGYIFINFKGVSMGVVVKVDIFKVDTKIALYVDKKRIGL